MHTHMLNRRLASVAALLMGSTGLMSLTANAQTTVDYTDLGTFTTPALTEGGVTVTGSADVNVLNLNGLGIVGGGSDFNVDGSETITFTFGGESVSISYFAPSAGQSGAVNNPSLVGERNLEAFSPSGTSLGSVAQDGVGSFDVSAVFGGVPIGSFSITPLPGESFRIGSLTFVVLPSGGLAVIAPTGMEEVARLSSTASVMGRAVAFNAHTLSRFRARESLSARDGGFSFSGAREPVSGPAQVNRLRTNSTAADRNLYTWVDLGGFRSEDPEAGRAYNGRGFQVGADIALSADMVVGLSFGLQDLDASVGTFDQDGTLRFVQPYFAYRAGAWCGEASLTYGLGSYNQTSVGGDGDGKTRLTAVAFTGSYDQALTDGIVVTPTLGLLHGLEKVEGTSGTLAGTSTETVRFTKVSFGTEISRSFAGGKVFGGVHADWLNTSSNTALVSDLLVDDGWTGRVELGVSTRLSNGLELDTSVELSGLGGDLQQTTGELRIAFRF